MTAVPMDWRDRRTDVTRAALCFSEFSPLFRRPTSHLIHVGDVFLDVLVGGGLLLHFVSQVGQSLVQGIGFPQGLTETGDR